MTWVRPAWLEAALGSAVASSALEPECQPAVGDIYVVSSHPSEDENRLALIWAVEEDFCRIALASNEIDCATDMDVLLRPVSTGLLFPLLVETDLVGPVWRSQLKSRLSSLPPPLSEEIASACQNNSASVAFERGLPAISDSPRLIWKESELCALHTIVRECLTRRVDGAVLDPVVLTRRFSDQPFEVQARVIERLASGEYALLVPIEDIASELVDSFGRDPDRWSSLEPLWNDSLNARHRSGDASPFTSSDAALRAASIVEAKSRGASIVFFASTDEALLSSSVQPGLDLTVVIEAITA